MCIIITFSEEQIHNMKAKAKELEKQAEKAITDLEAKLKEEAERKRIEDDAKLLKEESNKVTHI